jgi:hypothetical protein
VIAQIASVWNLEDPCIISGFDMDRVGAVAALSKVRAAGALCGIVSLVLCTSQAVQPGLCYLGPLGLLVLYLPCWVTPT